MLSLLAPALSLPFLGSFEIGLNVPTVLIGIAIVAIACALGFGASLVKKLGKPGAFIAGGGWGLAIILLVVASAVNPGGALHGDGAAATAAIAPQPTNQLTGATGKCGSTYVEANCESVSALTLTFADNASSHSAVSPAVKIYPAGVSQTDAILGTAAAAYSGTATSGTLTINVRPDQIGGCLADVWADLANYYNDRVYRNVNVCAEKNPFRNTVAPPTLYMDAIGTLSLSKTDTTLTCATGSQCTYSLTLRNSAANTVIHSPSVLLSNGATANATFDAVSPESAGVCTMETLSSGAIHVTFHDLQTSLAQATCNIKLTHAGAVATDTFLLTANDLFRVGGATAWNANSQFRGATVTGATTVTFAA